MPFWLVFLVGDLKGTHFTHNFRRSRLDLGFRNWFLTQKNTIPEGKQKYIIHPLKTNDSARFTPEKWGSNIRWWNFRDSFGAFYGVCSRVNSLLNFHGFPAKNEERPEILQHVETTSYAIWNTKNMSPILVSQNPQISTFNGLLLLVLGGITVPNFQALKRRGFALRKPWESKVPTPVMPREIPSGNSRGLKGLWHHHASHESRLTIPPLIQSFSGNGSMEPKYFAFRGSVFVQPKKSSSDVRWTQHP